VKNVTYGWKHFYGALNHLKELEIPKKHSLKDKKKYIKIIWNDYSKKLIDWLNVASSNFSIH
jgi:hypothetical protein